MVQHRNDDDIPATDTGSRTAIQVIDRLVSLLDALAEHPEAVSLKDLSRRTGLHPSTAHRILNDLVVVRAVGGRAPLHLTSVGKLFLAADDPRNVRAYGTRTGLAGHTRNSITSADKLERELSLVRSRGYARDNEELELGVRCIAAGVRDDAGKLVAGLSISAPADFLQDDWIELLVNTAGQISAAIGFDAAD